MISENLIVVNPWYWQQSNFDLNIFWNSTCFSAVRSGGAAGLWKFRSVGLDTYRPLMVGMFFPFQSICKFLRNPKWMVQKLHGSVCAFQLFFSYNRSMSSDLRMSVSKRRGAISGQPVQRPGRRNGQPPEEILHLAWQADEMRWRSLVKSPEGWSSTKDWWASGSVGLHIRWFHYPNHIEMNPYNHCFLTNPWANQRSNAKFLAMPQTQEALKVMCRPWSGTTLLDRWKRRCWLHLGRVWVEGEGKGISDMTWKWWRVNRKLCWYTGGFWAVLRRPVSVYIS